MSSYISHLISSETTTSTHRTQEYRLTRSINNGLFPDIEASLLFIVLFVIVLLSYLSRTMGRSSRTRNGPLFELVSTFWPAYHGIVDCGTVRSKRLIYRNVYQKAKCWFFVRFKWLNLLSWMLVEKRADGLGYTTSLLNTCTFEF